MCNQENLKAEAAIEQAQPLTDSETESVAGGHSHARNRLECSICRKRFVDAKAWHDHMVMVHGRK